MYRDHSHDPFLRAILENVEDDLPRLVYADWLEGRGDPRAEFIRVQIALDRLAWGDPRQPELQAREADLWQEYGQDWKADLPDLDDSFSWGDFHRGFPVAQVEVSHPRNRGVVNEVNRHADYIEGVCKRFNRWVDQLNPASLLLECELLR